MQDIWNSIHWQPTIGDPSLAGWSIATLYFITAAMSLMVYRNARFIFTSRIKSQAQLWMAIALLLLLLGINKQLDLQTLFTEIGRAIAKQGNWYKDRRSIQIIFVAAVAVLGTIVTIAMLVAYRKSFKNNYLALVGIVFLISYVLIRASSFHHIDKLIHSRLLSLQFNWLFESVGILLILANSLYLQYKPNNHLPSKQHPNSRHM